MCLILRKLKTLPPLLWGEGKSHSICWSAGQLPNFCPHYFCKVFDGFLAHLSYVQEELLGDFNVRHASYVASVTSVVNNFLINTLGATVLTQSFSNLLKMLVLIKSGSTSIMGGVKK